MRLFFQKYQGAGNDFIIINGIDNGNELSAEQVGFLCNRYFGIGADGLIIIESAEGYDYKMKYYNSDGIEATMCGNGGRCAALFAYNNNIAGAEQNFLASDGTHKAKVLGEEVILYMNDVSVIKKFDDGYFLNTGSPHFVKFINNISEIDVNMAGKILADDKRFVPDRTNVDFVEIGEEDSFGIATFERGVESETLACGTGAVAAAIILYREEKANKMPVILNAKGGKLSIDFIEEKGIYKNIRLTGPVNFVFEGKIELK